MQPERLFNFIAKDAVLLLLLLAQGSMVVRVPGRIPSA